MSQAEMQGMLDRFEVKLDAADAAKSRTNTTSNFAIGSRSGYELLLPKYRISTGRDGDAEAVSQARIYLDEASKWFSKKEFKIGEVEPDGKAYVGFLLTVVQESRSEKVQTTPLNGDNYSATFYGESPAVYSFQGILYNTKYARWRELFSILYDKAFRGSKISTHRKLLHLVYDNKIISGWMLNLSQTLSASSDTMSNFSFQFLVRKEVILSTGKELEYNNAYFTGAPVPNEFLDAIPDLPQYDDYLNVARIKPPPKRQRGSGKGKRYACRPSATATIKDGNKRKANPRFEGQYIRTGSPTASTCDVAQAMINVVKERNSAIKRAKARFNKNPNAPGAEKRKRNAIDSAEAKARRQLRVSYKNLKNTAEIKNQSARKRAEILFRQFQDSGASGSLSAFLASALADDDQTLQKIQSLVDRVPLDYTSNPTPEDTSDGSPEPEGFPELPTAGV